MTDQLRAELAAYLEKYYIPPMYSAMAQGAPAYDGCFLDEAPYFEEAALSDEAPYFEEAVLSGEEPYFEEAASFEDEELSHFPERPAPSMPSLARPQLLESKPKKRRPRIPFFSKEKQSLTSTQAHNLNDLMDELGESFHEKLFELIDASGMTDVDVYKRANLDRKLFSKIRSNPAYHPRKGTVLALAIALKLDIEEANDLLSRAEYAFSPGSKADLIVKFFIEHQVYDIDAVNYALDEYKLPILN